MPGNKIEDRIRSLYELDNFSWSRQQSQAVDSERPVLIYDEWVEKQRQINEPLSFGWKNSTLQQIDAVRGRGSVSSSVFGQNSAQLTQRPYLSRCQSPGQELNVNGFMVEQPNFQARQNQLEFVGECKGFVPHNLTSRDLFVLKSQQEYASGPGDSPTLTTNSEISEMTEASTEFNFVEGQQQLVKGQQSGIQQPASMQQSGYNDIQLLQQHIMFKQLQEFQRQQQLQQYGDARHQNSLNQHSSITKQAPGDQYSGLINGTPVSDASQMFMNWVQRGASPGGQGISSRVAFPQEQGQTLRSAGMVTQQFDASLYGTPVSSARGTGQLSHLQGMFHESPNLLNKVSASAQKHTMQPAAFNNPFVGDQGTVSPDQVCSPQGAFLPKHGFQGKNVFGQVPLQGFNTGVTFGNPLLGNSLQANSSFLELSGKQEEPGWPGLLQQKTMQHVPSQVPLDPMEEKILFNTDNDIWNSSLSRQNDMSLGGFEDTFEGTDYSNVFPSIQSGSWSALMQSAVAEASSSDTGVQEEWSGLTFQNTELSTDNQPSNILDSEKQQRCWADNPLQSDSSLGSKPFSTLNDSSVTSSFPGFHPQGVQFMTKQRDLRQDDSHDSIQKSPKNTGEWSDFNPQPNLPVEGSEKVQRLMHFDNTWSGQMNEHAESNAHQRRMASHDIVSQSSSKPEGHTNEAMYSRRDSDNVALKIDSDCGQTSFSRSTVGLAQLESGIGNTLPSRENSQMYNFAAVRTSDITEAHQKTSQQFSDNNQLVNISMNNDENDSQQYQMGNSSIGKNADRRAVETYGQQQSCYPRDNSYNNYNSKGLSGRELEYSGQFKFAGNVHSNSIGLEKGNLPTLQRDSGEANKQPSRGDLSISATFQGPIGSGSPSINAQTSQHMIQLLHKVDQSKENMGTPFASTGFSPLYEVNSAGSAGSSIAQIFNQPSVSQGFDKTLRLAPPSQQVVKSNTLLYPRGEQQAASNLNIRQGHSDLGEKNQSQSVPLSTFHPVVSSNESSPRHHWDNKFNNVSERTDMSSPVDRSSPAAIPSDPLFARNELQMQPMSNRPILYTSSQAPLPGTASRFPPFNLAVSQDTSQQLCINPSGQQYQGPEAVTISHPLIVSGMPQQGGLSGRLNSLWTNRLMQQHLSGMETSKAPGTDCPSNGMEISSLNTQELNNQDYQKAGYKPSDLGACSINSQGSVHGEDQPRKEGSQKMLSVGMLDASQTGPRNISDVNALASGSMVVHSHQQDLDRFLQSHNNSPAASERSHESSGHSMKSSYGVQHNYSLLHQIQSMKNVEADHSRKAVNSASQLSSTSANLNVLTEARDDLGLKASVQSSPQDMLSQGLVAFHQNDFQSHPSGSNVVPGHVENSRAYLNVGPSWFQQYGTMRNGQLPPMYEAKHSGPAAVQFSLVKPSQNIHSSVERQEIADVGQGRSLPSTTAAFVASEPISASDKLSTVVINEGMATVRPKKRKTPTSERLPWHKEVALCSTRDQSISNAELDWARASNRLIEKVEDEVEMIEDGKPLLRSKRRLIITTQLMQQLLHPAPAPVLAANAALHYESLMYYVARQSLGNACSLTYKNPYSCMPLKDSNMISEEHKVSGSTDDQHFSKAVEDFTNRSKKLEDEFLRLDKAASTLDVKMECQDLERVSVINRFAQFHIRQVDASGTSTPVLKICPQRYVTVQQMPRNIPEGVQCLSL
ncbi:hypothetical protein UlMin_014618 [Ulmus minor]